MKTILYFQSSLAASNMRELEGVRKYAACRNSLQFARVNFWYNIHISRGALRGVGL